MASNHSELRVPSNSVPSTRRFVLCSCIQGVSKTPSLLVSPPPLGPVMHPSFTRPAGLRQMASMDAILHSGRCFLLHISPFPLVNLLTHVACCCSHRCFSFLLGVSFCLSLLIYFHYVSYNPLRFRSLVTAIVHPLHFLYKIRPRSSAMEPQSESDCHKPSALLGRVAEP